MCEELPPPPLRVGVAVLGPRRTASERNRIKRRLRESFRLERAALDGALAASGVSVSLILAFKGNRFPETGRIPFESYRADVRGVLRMLLPHLEQWQKS